MFEGKDVKIVLANAGAGKGNWVECRIPTPQGTRRFGDLKEGDFVFDREGNPTKVLKVYKRGFMDAYKVTLSDGRSTIVSLDHLWNVYTSTYSKEMKTISLEEMLKTGIRKPDSRKGRVLGSPRFYLPVHKARFYDIAGKLPVHPYVFGAFLGNGCLTSDYLEFSSNDEETVEFIASRLNCSYKKRSSKNYTWDFYDTKTGKKLKTEDFFTKAYAKDKYIPDCYKYTSMTKRFFLLQGLFDTDGCATYDGKRLHVSYSSVSEKLIKDVQEVLNSVGIISVISTDKREGRNICYNLRVNASTEAKQSLFSLQRKYYVCANAQETKHHYDRVAVRSVEKLTEKLEINCIYVDNPEHLYQCDDGIVTHNTHYIIEDITKELEVRRPEEIAFVTFTRKGAQEGLRRICSKLMFEPEDLPYFRTLHSLTFHALGLKPKQMFGRIDQRKFNKKYGFNLNRCEASFNKNVMLTKDSQYLDFYDLERSNALTSQKLADYDIEQTYYQRLVKNYETYKEENHLVDYFDCLINFLKEGEPLPCKIVYCDECQDLTMLQWQVLDKAFSKAEKIICVGDDKQSIFSYSGARPDILISLSKQFPVEHLPMSYRLPKRVFELANAITRFIGDKTEQKSVYREENPEGSITEINTLDRLLNFIDEKEIMKNNDDTVWYILSRNNCFLSRPKKLLEDALIPYWTADGFFMGGDIMQRLKDYENYRYAGYKNEAKKEEFMRKYGIIDFSSPFTDTNLFTEERKWVYFSYIERYGLKKLEEMCKWNPQILVSTVHHVKGGECEHCALMLDNTRRTKGNVFKDLDEELRILYVAVTRTKKDLILIDSADGEGYNEVIQTIKDENNLQF